MAMEEEQEELADEPERHAAEIERLERLRRKEMARLTHSEYVLTGAAALDVRDVLRETLLAPTVTGSPLENAFRVIARHESTGRGHYSGVLALIGRDARAAVRSTRRS